MTFRTVNPGDDLPSSALLLNAMIGAANVFASGEAEARGNPLLMSPSRNIVRAVGNGTTWKRGSIVDLDVAAVSAEDNEDGYLSGTEIAIRITGAPAADRLAFVGVCVDHITGDAAGSVAVAGPVVTYVRGDGMYAWPAAGDSEAFATNDTGGYPIFDRGPEDEDGKRMAYILLSSRTAMAANGDTTLPAGSVGCNCDDECVAGTANTDCEGCDCFNSRRRIFPPKMVKPDGTVWVEASASRVMKKIPGQCRLESATFPLECTVGEEEVSDDYKWVTYQIPSSPGVPACWKTKLEIVLGEEEEPACGNVVVAEFDKDATACTAAGADCLCPWHFNRGIFENIRRPKNCKLCVTPIFRGTKPVCSLPCEFPEVMQVVIPDMPDDGEVGTFIVGQTLDLFWDDSPDVADAEWENEVTIQKRADPEGGLTDYTAIARLYVFCGGDEPFVQFGFREKDSDDFQIGWGGDESAVAQVLCDDGELEIGFKTSSGANFEDWPDSIEVKSNGQAAAITSGHTGGGCGSADPCETQRCVWEVAQAGDTKFYKVSADSTCTSECGDCYVTCAETYANENGAASDHEVGDKFEMDCRPPQEEGAGEIVTGAISYAGGSGGCACGEGITFQMCSGADGVFTGSISFCGVSYEFSYYFDEGDGYYHLDGGPPGNDTLDGSYSASPSGPFNFFFGVTPPCDNFKVTISA